MSDYRDYLDRFLTAWEQFQRDTQAQELVQELADRNKLPVEDVQATLARIDFSLRRLGIARRPTEAETVDLALKHAKPAVKKSNWDTTCAAKHTDGETEV